MYGIEGRKKIIQSRNARTQYIVIPADIVADSQYPFKAGERIRICVDPFRKMLIITSAETSTIKVSPEGLYIEGKKVKVVEG